MSPDLRLWEVPPDVNKNKILFCAHLLVKWLAAGTGNITLTPRIPTLGQAQTLQLLCHVSEIPVGFCASTQFSMEQTFPSGLTIKVTQLQQLHVSEQRLFASNWRGHRNPSPLLACHLTFAVWWSHCSGCLCSPRHFRSWVLSCSRELGLFACLLLASVETGVLLHGPGWPSVYCVC